MNFKNNILPLGRGGRFLLTYDQRGMQKGGGDGVKIHFGTHSQSTKYSLDTNPLRLVGFTTEIFSMKIHQKIYTQSSNLHSRRANEVQTAPSPGCRH